MPPLAWIGIGALSAIVLVVFGAVLAPWIPFIWECVKWAPKMLKDNPKFALPPLAVGVIAALVTKNIAFVFYGIVATFVVGALLAILGGLAVWILFSLIGRA